MRLRFWHIVLVLLAVASCRGPRTIPRDTLGEIFYDMFLQDQQIRNDISLKRIADTSLVYEGIFREYGYSTDDYLYTMDKYIRDPAKLSKVFEKVGDRLDKEVKGIKKEVEFEEWRKKYLAIYKHRIDTTSLPLVPLGAVDTMYFHLHKDEIKYFPPPDTLTPVLDTMVFRLDTLARCDSLAIQIDSL
ncbi:MAG: DUF4296 domain-containing protein [Bacteroidales bacterium]|nr:DUF4296 domain-containing protein [Bacteroidales bacterium]